MADSKDLIARLRADNKDLLAKLKQAERGYTNLGKVGKDAFKALTAAVGLGSGAFGILQKVIGFCVEKLKYLVFDKQNDDLDKLINKISRVGAEMETWRNIQKDSQNAANGIISQMEKVANSAVNDADKIAALEELFYNLSKANPRLANVEFDATKPAESIQNLRDALNGLVTAGDIKILEKQIKNLQEQSENLGKKQDLGWVERLGNFAFGKIGLDTFEEQTKAIGELNADKIITVIQSLQDGKKIDLSKFVSSLNIADNDAEKLLKNLQKIAENSSKINAANIKNDSDEIAKKIAENDALQKQITSQIETQKTAEEKANKEVADAKAKLQQAENAENERIHKNQIENAKEYLDTQKTYFSKLKGYYNKIVSGFGFSIDDNLNIFSKNQMKAKSKETKLDESIQSKIAKAQEKGKAVKLTKAEKRRVSAYYSAKNNANYAEWMESSTDAKSNRIDVSERNRNKVIEAQRSKANLETAQHGLQTAQNNANQIANDLSESRKALQTLVNGGCFVVKGGRGL